MLELAQTGRTHDLYLSQVGQAQMVNRVLGGYAVGPWDVGELPADWMDVFRGLENELPGMQNGMRQVEAVRDRFLRSHPTYRK